MANRIPISEADFLSQYNIHDYDVPLTSVDMAIFAVIEQKLHVLLIQRNEYPSQGKWALPGGFIDLKHDQTISDTAHRKLFEKTGIRSPHLEQVQTIGQAKRDPRGWSVTVLYFALIDYLAIHANKHKQLTELTQWVPLEEAHAITLAFDHHQLLSLAVERLRSKTRYTALPVSLMPELFTLTELQTIFEVILGHALDKKAFRRRVLDSGILQATELSKRSGKRDAQLYRVLNVPDDFEFPRALGVVICPPFQRTV
jgi:ADP-ribose pyrophosphatase YjhB (NUDIX family)